MTDSLQKNQQTESRKKWGGGEGRGRGERGESKKQKEYSHENMPQCLDALQHDIGHFRVRRLLPAVVPCRRHGTPAIHVIISSNDFTIVTIATAVIGDGVRSPITAAAAAAAAAAVEQSRLRRVLRLGQTHHIHRLRRGRRQFPLGTIARRGDHQIPPAPVRRRCIGIRPAMVNTGRRVMRLWPAHPTGQRRLARRSSQIVP